MASAALVFPLGFATQTAIRKRRSYPKVRSDCLTCKIRRKKCDEQKPSCHRCVSTGRKCDGYATYASKEQQICLTAGPEAEDALSAMTGRYNRSHTLPTPPASEDEDSQLASVHIVRKDIGYDVVRNKFPLHPALPVANQSLPLELFHSPNSQYSQAARTIYVSTSSDYALDLTFPAILTAVSGKAFSFSPAS